MENSADRANRVGKAQGNRTDADRHPAPRCEDCEFYDYDQDEDAYVCQVSLDEDEMASFVAGQTGRCPYYRYYDEYKSVHKQI
jgi:hypothetical protein